MWERSFVSLPMSPTSQPSDLTRCGHQSSARIHLFRNPARGMAVHTSWSFDCDNSRSDVDFDVRWDGDDLLRE